MTPYIHTEIHTTESMHKHRIKDITKCVVQRLSTHINKHKHTYINKYVHKCTH